jgi:hypothetical protein
VFYINVSRVWCESGLFMCYEIYLEDVYISPFPSLSFFSFFLNTCSVLPFFQNYLLINDVVFCSCFCATLYKNREGTIDDCVLLLLSSTLLGKLLFFLKSSYQILMDLFCFCADSL